MTPEQPEFSLENELNKLSGVDFEPVPSDKKINTAYSIFLKIDEDLFLNLKKPKTRANQVCLEPRRCDLSKFNLSPDNLKILTQELLT